MSTARGPTLHFLLGLSVGCMNKAVLLPMPLQRSDLHRRHQWLDRRPGSNDRSESLLTRVLTFSLTGEKTVTPPPILTPKFLGCLSSSFFIFFLKLLRAARGNKCIKPSVLGLFLKTSLSGLTVPEQLLETLISMAIIGDSTTHAAWLQHMRSWY